MPIYMTATFQVKKESVAKCKDAIAAFIAHVADNEPDTRLYMALEEGEAPTRFLHVFWFASEEAEQVHRHSDYVKRFTDTLYPETLSGVEFKRYSLVASNRT
jgi:quinol monooxygenase YgiN